MPLLSTLLFLTATPIFALPCTDYLIKQSVPWIEPVILNAPAVQNGEVIGKTAIWRDKIVAARPCKWCPKFTSQNAANEWFKNHPLGAKTVQAGASLIRLSRKGYADTFYGFALANGELHFIAKIPEGMPLRHRIETRGPWTLEARASSFPGARVLQISGLGPIKSATVRSAAKISGVLNDPETLLPFPYISYGIPGPDRDISLLDFFNAIEWSVLPSGELKVSFYNLEKIFDANGALRAPLGEYDIGQPAIGYGRILLGSLALLSNNVGRSWTYLLNAKVATFFWLPYMSRALKEGPLHGDPLLLRVRDSAAQVHLSPIDSLVHVFDPGELGFHEPVSFASPERLREHFEKHGKTFGANSEEGYLNMARRFLAGENVAEEAGLKSDNRRVMYMRLNEEPNEQVILDPDSRITIVLNEAGVLKTFFIQSNESSGMDPEQYIVEQARRDLEGGWRFNVQGSIDD